MTGVYYLKGSESFLRDAYTRKLTEGIGEVRKTEGFSEDDLYWLSDPGFLGGNKGLVMEYKELGADEKLLKALQGAEDFGGTLIVSAAKAPENTKIHKFLSANAEVKKCDPLCDADYEKFVRQRIGHYRLKIRPSDYGYFVERSCYGYSDADLVQADTWLHQLSFYEEVTRKEIDAVVRIREEQTAFSISEMLGTKGVEDVLSFALDFTGDYIAVLSALHYSLRQAYRVKTLGADKAGISSWQVKKLGGILRKDVTAIAEALGQVADGICLIKRGMKPQDAYLFAMGMAVKALS